MKGWTAGRVSGREGVQAERFHWEQVTGDWVLPVVEPWHEKWSQITRNVGKKGSVQLKTARGKHL